MIMNSENGKASKKKIVVIAISSLLLIVVIFIASFIIIKFTENENRKCTYTDMTSSGSDEKYGRIYYSPIDEEHIVSSKEGFKYIDNEILVVAKEDVSKSDVEKLADKYNAEIVGEIEITGDYQLKIKDISSENDIFEIIESVQLESIVESATPDYVCEVSEAAFTEKRSGFYYGGEWNEDLQNSSDAKGISWGIEAINTFEAWDILSKNSDKVNQVKVGLIDSGFDISHEDLGFAEVFYDNGVNGVNSLKKEHGTHVAGTMAAKADNKMGICGVYPYGNGNLYGVSVIGGNEYSENGTYKTSSMFQKIAFAELIVRNVKIINQSTGFNYCKKEEFKDENNSVDYQALRNWWIDTSNFDENVEEGKILGDFLNRMLINGYDFVIVSAAGNDSDSSIGHLDCRYSSWNNIISYEDYPDVYDRIIVVGSVNEEMQISSFSNGGERVDVYAPGENIFSSLPNNKYGNNSGTSMAAPHVSGVAAMVWSANNSLKGDEVKKIVCGSYFDDKENGENRDARYQNARCTSCNMVDARMAVAVAMNEETDEITAATEKTTEDGGILCYVVDKDDEDIKIQNAKISVTNKKTKKMVEAQTDSNGHFELMAPGGEYIIKVTAKNYNSYTGEVNISSGEINYLDDWIKLTRTEESKYYEYLKSELIPEYGLASSDPFTIAMNPPKTADGISVYGMYNTNYGIVDIDIDDYNGDGHKEMLVLSLKEEYDKQYICNIVLSLYGTSGKNISLYDSKVIQKYSMESGIEHCYNFFRLEKYGSNFLLTNNCLVFSGENMHSMIKIISLKNNKIKNNIIRYSSNHDGEYQLYYNDEMVYEVATNYDDEKANSFINDSKKFIGEKLTENDVKYDSVIYKGYSDENKHKEFRVESSESKIITEYSAEYNYPEESVITPDSNTDFREKIAALYESDNLKAVGTCGVNVSWELDKEGLLRIYGEGEIDHAATAMHEPWAAERENIKKIVIEDGIISIGECAFMNCVNVKEIAISNSVESIGRYVFSGCKKLEEITIPESVKTIEKYSFSDCSSLKKLNILNKDINIANSVFNDKVNVSEVRFSGTKSEWKDAFISPETNSGLYKAQIHCSDTTFEMSEMKPTKSSESQKEDELDNRDYKDYVGKVKIDDGYLNVRESPSLDGKIIGKLTNGAEVTIESKTEDKKWYKININGSYGYVSSEFIALINQGE